MLALPTMHAKTLRTIAFCAGALFTIRALPTSTPSLAQQVAPRQAIDQAYAQDIRPLIEQYCSDCHTGDEAEAEIDLHAFASIEDARRQPKVWQKVATMLDSGQMPPKDAEQPTDDERLRMQQWVRSFLTAEAQSRAGDPGPVVLRRLSNAEYTYTVRDLTGIDTLDPAREFPIDGAAGEGFTNTGNALVMSPSLIQKYLASAKEIAQHAVLVPNGIRFSPNTTERDWTDELLTSIQQVYARWTDPTGGKKINLHGLEFDTDQGGRLPLEQYLSATLTEREALSSGRKTIATVADEHSLNAKYLSKLWQALAQNDVPNESFVLDPIRRQWRGAKPKDVESLLEQIGRWQAALWKFNTIGHIGRENSPSAWMEANFPVVAEQEFRLELVPSPDGKQWIDVFLAATAVGDNEDGYVIWKNARLEGDDGPPIPLRDVAGLQRRINYAELLTDVEADDRFGKHPQGGSADSSDLIVSVPDVTEFHLPAELAAGRTLVVTGHVESPENCAHLEVSLTKPKDGKRTVGELVATSPFVATKDGAAHRRLRKVFTEFRDLFPPALCYARIVPIDEVVTLTLFYRQDEHLQRLMLDEQQVAELDRMWDELFYVSREPLRYLVAFEQIREFSTQDRPDLVKAWKVLIQPANERADAFRQRLLDTEPIHLQAVVDLAERAWRRALTKDEKQRLRDTYHELRDNEIQHDESIRLTIARVLAAPAFLYRLEKPGPDDTATPVSNAELANRLSYFLWSSMPDDELLRAAESGELLNERSLLEQARRMLKDQRTRRLAIHFACQWLHIRDFDQNDEKNEKLYPQFAAMRGHMYEETVRFFEDMFRNDGSILDLLDADHAFLNEDLAKHYGIDGVTGTEWRKVDDMRANARGGVLGMATVLARLSGASRTSPILRGDWVSETLLGERLPRPPANVPQLPEEVPTGLTARQLIEQHTSVPECAKCHARIDPYGFALEQYDAIGRLRGQAVDTETTLFDGKTIEGIDGLRNYLANDRRDDVVRQFCKKLLGYSLGREVQLSDEPLLAEINRKLAANDYRFSVVVEEIVKSPQFRNIRGRQMVDN